MLQKPNVVAMATFLLITSSTLRASEGDEAKSSKKEEPEKPVLFQNGTNTKKGRSALFSPQARIFPFLEQILNPLFVPPHISGPGLPTSPIHPGIADPIFGSLPAGVSKPDCSFDRRYCLHDSTYPSDKINSIVDRYYDDVRGMYTSLYRMPFKDMFHHDNITHRYREGGHFVCESKVQYVRPGWARNIRGEWLAIINTETFPQVVRVEECKYGERRCEYLPPCYKSTCVQRYNFEKLLSVDPRNPRGKPIVDIFEIPTACSCFVENFVYY